MIAGGLAFHHERALNVRHWTDRFFGFVSSGRRERETLDEVASHEEHRAGGRRQGLGFRLIR